MFLGAAENENTDWSIILPGSRNISDKQAPSYFLAYQLKLKGIIQFNISVSSQSGDGSSGL